MKKLLLAAFLFLAPAISFAQAIPNATPPVAGMAPQIGVTPTPIVIDQRPPADTSVSVGTLGADVIEWLGAVAIPVLGTFLTKWLMALAKKAGVELSQAQSDKLDGMIENGLHDALAKAGADLTGKLTVDVKNKAVADAVAYAQAHGADTIKAMSGVDVSDPKVTEALQARAAKLLNKIGPDAVLKPTAAVPAAPVNVSVQPDRAAKV